MIALAVAFWPDAASADERLRIETFLVAGGAQTTGSDEVTLDTRVAGGADEIRTSEDRRMRDAPWRPYADAVPFRLRPEGRALRTIYVQVRRGGALSEIASARIRYLPATARYPLPLAAARDHVEALGWRFAATPANPASACTLRVDAHRILLAARQTRPAIDGVCDLVLFGGEGRLARGWRFVRFERTRGDLPYCRFRFLEFPVIEGDRITFRMRILELTGPADKKPDSAYRPLGCAYSISKIVLEGPTGRDWRDAFNR
ncbi:MAG: hypothetical protein QNJ94_21340 [Alphaproteobacteria bacterium]|nr:hypothetical protein [Alphaproteobacteria bacterium]